LVPREYSSGERQRRGRIGKAGGSRARSLLVEAAPNSPMAHIAVVSFEPGGDFPFPEGEAPPPMTLGGREVRPPAIPLSEFMQLTKIPVVIYYGDNIPEKPSANPGQEQWRVFLETARRWRDAVNKRGGNVTLVHLSEIGVRGNTHFPMSDLNNLQVADLMSKVLKEKGLD
jgi:Transposase IS116/IS110/IS902 family